MRTTRFESRPLPARCAARLMAALGAAHRREPFSTTDPRATARRVARIAEALSIPATLYRGALDLGGAEVDHLWVDVHGCVVDAAYPVFATDFLALLRRWIVDEAPVEALAAVAGRAALDQRVLGVFPDPLRYLGAPVWSAHARGEG